MNVVATPPWGSFRTRYPKYAQRLQREDIYWKILNGTPLCRDHCNLCSEEMP